jgi:hypothetical protein
MSGMSESTFTYINERLHLLDIDLENGVILNRNVKNSFAGSGYPSARLKGKTVYQHQIFAVKRWGNKCIGMTVNHINEIKTDNSYENLELVPLTINLKARTKGGTPKKPIIANNLDTGEVFIFNSQSEAANRLGFSKSRISQILSGVNKHAGKYLLKRID